MVDQSAFQRQFIFNAPTFISGVAFRLAQAEDLAALWESCYPETDREQFQEHYRYLLRWQEHGRCYILIAERHTEAQGQHPRIVGSGQLIPQREKAEIAELAVHPDFQSRGIGTAMIEILTQIAQERRIEVLEIGVAVENVAALRLYRRLGFGRERLLGLPTGQEAIILQKRLA